MFPVVGNGPSRADCERDLDTAHGTCAECGPGRSCDRRDYEGHVWWTRVTGARTLTREEYRKRAERLRARK